MRRTEEADAECARAVEAALSLHGPAHPLVADALVMRAEAIEPLDRRRAMALLTDALTIYRSSVGEVHPMVARIFHYRSLERAVAGDLATAERFHRRAVELYRATVGEHHPNLAYAHQQFAGQLSRRREVGAATRSYRRAIAAMAGGLGPSHPRLVWLYSQLAVHLASHGRGGEQEARTALELSQGVARSAGTAVAMVTLARILGEQGRVAEARQMEESLQAAAAEIPARFRRRVAGLYASWQRPEAARFWSELGSAGPAPRSAG